MAETLKFNTSLDNAGFAAGMAKIEAAGAKAASKLAASFTAVGTALTAAAAGAAIGMRFLEGTEKAFEAGRQLEILARQTGASVRGLAALQEQFRAAGLEGDKVGVSIARLQKSIAGVEDGENKGGPARLQQLGLTLAELARLAPDKQLERVGRAIAAVRDPAERTAAAMQIFGRAGAELGSLFSGNFGTLPEELDKRSRMLADNAARFERISIMIQRAGEAFRSFYLGVGVGLSDGLEPVLERLDKLDLSRAGKDFGAGIGEAARALVPVLDRLEKIDFAKWETIARVMASVGTSVVKTVATNPVSPLNPANPVGLFGPGVAGASAVGSAIGRSGFGAAAGIDPLAAVGALGGIFAKLGQAAAKKLPGRVPYEFDGPLSMDAYGLAKSEGRNYTGASDAVYSTKLSTGSLGGHAMPVGGGTPGESIWHQISGHHVNAARQRENEKTQKDEEAKTKAILETARNTGIIAKHHDTWSTGGSGGSGGGGATLTA